MDLEHAIDLPIHTSRPWRLGGERPSSARREGDCLNAPLRDAPLAVETSRLFSTRARETFRLAAPAHERCPTSFLAKRLSPEARRLLGFLYSSPIPLCRRRSVQARSSSLNRDASPASWSTVDESRLGVPEGQRDAMCPSPRREQGVSKLVAGEGHRRPLSLDSPDLEHRPAGTGWSGESGLVALLA